MTIPNALFPEARQETQEIQLPGFGYQEEAVTPLEEQGLEAALRQLDLRPFEFHGHLGDHRVVSFGLKYDFSVVWWRRPIRYPSFSTIFYHVPLPL